MTNLGYLGSYLTYFLKKIGIFNGVQLIPHINSAYHYIAIGVIIRHLCLQRGP